MSHTNRPTEGHMLCVSIHDVAPATWADCLRLVQAVRAVADIPLTWLVVPHYHFRPEQSPAMDACLNVALERGDELALHGYSHLDTEANGGGLRARFLRNVYTRREGEFAALSEAEARRRLELGLDWFAQRGWTPTGFVPPAWLLGEGAWRALRDSCFAYTTTFSHFHCLPGARNPRAATEGRRGPVLPEPERGGGQRYDVADRQGRHRAGGAQAHRGQGGASIQYGSGSVQNGQGNHAAQGGGNRQFDSRQFDSRDWTGHMGPDSGYDVRGAHDTFGRNDQRDGHHAADRRDASTGHDASGRHDAPGQDDDAGLHEQHGGSGRIEQNNRHGTHAILSPSLVYAARNRGGRILSPRLADATAAMLAHAPLVRFSLHPPDARYPELVRHIQQVLERLLERREAVTKAECARRLTSTDPTSLPANTPDPSRNTRGTTQSAASRTSY